MNFNRSWLENAILRDEDNRRIVQISDFNEEFTVVREGENFMSEVSRVTIKATTASGVVEKRSYIVKKVPDSEAMRGFHKMFGIFGVETRIYTEVLQGMEELMKNTGDTREKSWCQLVGHIPETAIVLEDLNAQGYKKMKKYDLLDEEHAIHVLKELARYHAMGSSLISQNMINTENMKCLPILDETSRTMYYMPALNAIRSAVQHSWGPTWSDLLGPLNHLIDNFSGIIKKLDELSLKSLNVVSHGDCWTGNFMFKHDFQGQVLSMKFIDFQFSACSTFAFDLCVFLKNSVQTKVRIEKLDHLLHVYQHKLKANLQFFNVDPTVIPTLSEVKSILKSLEVLSFLVMIIYYPLVGEDTNFSFDESFDEQKDANGSVYTARMYSTEKCKRVLGQELKALIAKGLFNNC